MRAHRLLPAVIAVGLALAAAASQAGRSCENKAPDAANVQRAMTLAEHTARALDASGAQVVVLARAGQDLSKYHLAWSHLGLAYRDGQRWRVVHKLNSAAARKRRCTGRAWASSSSTTCTSTRRPS
jgi:hypothetical protein